MNKPSLGWMFLSILTGSAILPVLCYPSLNENSQLQPHVVLPEARKYAEKPNATKKVPSAVEDRNELEDVQQTNQIPQDSSFWGSVLNMVMQLLFNPNGAAGPSKSDAIETDSQPSITASPWTSILAVGFKILSTFLGAGTGSDGIDKVDNNSNSPMQGILAAIFSTVLGTKDQDQVASMAKQTSEFLTIVMSLLETLKTSFSHRAMAARSLNKRDSIADAAMAGITFVKGYVRTMKAQNDSCVRKIMCEASKECAEDQPNGIFCQLGTYATSTILQKTWTLPYESLQEAGRRGRSARSADECKQVYVCSDN